MHIDMFVRRLRDKAHKREREISDELSKGVAKDFAEYKLFVGRLRGVREIEVLVNELCKELEIEADE